MSWGARSQMTFRVGWNSPSPTLTASTYRTSPRSPEEMSRASSWTAALYSKVCPVINVNPDASACKVRVAALWEEVVSGFSTRTCRPASRASEAMVKCVSGGVQMATASIPASNRAR